MCDCLRDEQREAVTIAPLLLLVQRNAERLDRKRVVVYQFAERELAFGDWKLIELPESGTP